MNKKLRYILGWLFIRPIRWFFWRAISNCYLQAKFERDYDGSIRWPNIHWWIAYQTVYKFFSWLNWDAWRYFCNWDGGYRNTFPIVARVIKKIGELTAGVAQYGGSQCYHCASSEGSQLDLADDETGTTFILGETWTSATENGTDHCYDGITICPKCGFRDHFQDSSL